MICGFCQQEFALRHKCSHATVDLRVFECFCCDKMLDQVQHVICGQLRVCFSCWEFAVQVLEVAKDFSCYLDMNAALGAVSAFRNNSNEKNELGTKGNSLL